MARVVLILVICTILMFVVVLQTPPQFVRTMLSSYVNFAESAAPAEKQKDAQPEKQKKAATRQVAARKSTGPATVLRSSAPSATPEAVPAPVESLKTAPVGAPSRNSARVFSVANDGTALYSHNSPNGTIVKVLRKGAIVEPQLEINDAGQMWEFVNVIGENTSGFLRASSLERQQSAQRLQ